MDKFILSKKQFVETVKYAVKTAIVALVGAFAKKYTARVIKNFGV